MRKAFRTAAFALALIFAAALCGCHKEKEQVKPEKGGETVLSEEQNARAAELGRAFSLFGECDIDKGLELRRVEYMIYCMYTGTLGPTDVEGYGMISREEADEMLRELFNGFDPKSIVRTKYDAEEDQALYLSGDRYFVKLSDLSAYEYKVTASNELVDRNGERLGDVVTVSVINGGTPEMALRLELIDSAEAVYSIRKCTVEYYD